MNMYHLVSQVLAYGVNGDFAEQSIGSNKLLSGKKACDESLSNKAGKVTLLSARAFTPQDFFRKR